MQAHLKLLLGLFVLYSGTAAAQVQYDTLRFTIYYIENKIEAQESLLDQVDSVLNKAGFSDLVFETEINKLIIYGHSDNTGSRSANQRLSEKRAGAVADYLNAKYKCYDVIVLGFGPSKPLGTNSTANGRAINRRVELTVIYQQKKVSRTSPSKEQKSKDTVLTYEDGTKLKINLTEYQKIGHCLIYQQKNKLIDIYSDLALDQTEENYFLFGKVTLNWCSTECLGYPITLSLQVSDSIVKLYL
jgi:hypothetical protein